MMDHAKHSSMSHGGMDHSEPMCNMNMLFTWDSTDLCIIFRSWHVHSTGSLIWYLFIVVVLTAGYELVRETSRRYETALASEGRVALENPEGQPSSQFWLGRASSVVLFGHKRSKLIKAILYATQVFYSFFVMLLFMTYNGWVMLAVAVGAFIGYLVFGHSSSTKTIACH